MNKTVFYSLFTLVLISTSFLSGCRFGNYADQAKPLKSQSSYNVEFFFTSPKQFETRVYLNALSGPNAVINTNNKASLSSIPSTILNVFSDPVYLAVPKDPSLSPVFRDYTDTYGFDTTLDSNGNIARDYIPTEGPFVLWSNPNCLTQYEITHEGTLDRTKPGSITYSDGTKAPVAGSMALTYTFSRIIDGDCSEDLTRLASCYNDGTGCTANELSSARSLFDLYIKQTGVLKIEDAAKIKALEYIVHYE